MAPSNFLDRAIGAVAPAWALNRVKARAQLASMTARAEYDGATVGRRSFSWKRKTTDANAELTPTTMQLLRGMAHDLVRNNPYAARGVGGIAETMVGSGITFRVMRGGEVDATLTTLAKAHLETTACDAEGRHDFYGLQLQAARTIVESGALLNRRRWRRAKDGLPVPFQMQLLEPDYINMSATGPMANSSGYRIRGIEFDSIGRRSGYNIFSGHPGSATAGSLETKVIPAEDIAHCFRADRPEQQHGVTWFTPVIVRMKDFGEYADAQLVRQKIAACFAAFRIGDPDDDLADTDSNGVPIEVDANQDYLEPGIIQTLPAGGDIKFADPPSVDGYADFSRVSLQEVATGLGGVPYELLTGDLSNVSFISGRLGRLQFKRSIETWQWTMFIPQFCEPVGVWFLEAAAMLGHNVEGCTFEWTTPAFEMMDPASEVPAKVAEIRAGLISWPEAIRERGRDPRLVAAEMAATNKLWDDLGLTLDCDPRQVTQVGNAVTMPNADARSTKVKP